MINIEGTHGHTGRCSFNLNFRNRWTFFGKFMENPKFWNETWTIQPKIPRWKSQGMDVFGKKLSEIASEYSFPGTADNAVPFTTWNFWECRMKSAYYLYPVVGGALNVYVALRLTIWFADREFWYGRVHCSCYYWSFDLFSVSLWLVRAYLYNPSRYHRMRSNSWLLSVLLKTSFSVFVCNVHGYSPWHGSCVLAAISVLVKMRILKAVHGITSTPVFIRTVLTSFH